ncbi:MAG: hypothetical protein HQL21_07120 [Candidatus Omnitrophica bacterium]|nr:hypothetical protein [Candidatus Omnitrophota bacterium]
MLHSAQFRSSVKPWAGHEPKVIIITGSASGFGKAAAKKLIAQGHIVYGGDINSECEYLINKKHATHFIVRAERNRYVHEDGTQTYNE